VSDIPKLAARCDTIWKLADHRAPPPEAFRAALTELQAAMLAADVDTVTATYCEYRRLVSDDDVLGLGTMRITPLVGPGQLLPDDPDRDESRRG